MNQTYTVAEAIRRARLDEPARSLRDVAEKAGVSAAQISRIENGHVANPSAETLVAIARGLELNPFFLLVLSGHVSEGEARRRLLHMFEEGSEIQQEWDTKAEDIRRDLNDPETAVDQIHRIAFDLFIGEPLWDVAWDDSYLLMAGGDSTEQTREIATLLAAIIDERRPRVIEYLKDQVELSRRDLIRSYEADAAEANRMMASGDWPSSSSDGGSENES